MSIVSRQGSGNNSQQVHASSEFEVVHSDSGRVSRVIGGYVFVPRGACYPVIVLDYRTSDGKKVNYNPILKGVHHNPCYKEGVVHGIPVSYFEYPSGFFVQNECQIECLSPPKMKGWSTQRYSGGFCGTMEESRQYCEEELATRVRSVFSSCLPLNPAQ